MFPRDECAMDGIIWGEGVAREMLGGAALGRRVSEDSEEEIAIVAPAVIKISPGGQRYEQEGREYFIRDKGRRKAIGRWIPFGSSLGAALENTAVDCKLHGSRCQRSASHQTLLGFGSSPWRCA